MSQGDINVTINAKEFKEYCNAFKSKVSNLTVPINEYKAWHRSQTINRWRSGKDYLDKSFAALKQSTIDNKKGAGILLETEAMFNSLEYSTAKLYLTYGISDYKYTFHHYGTRKMPQRRIIGDNPKTDRAELLIILRRYFRRIKGNKK